MTIDRRSLVLGAGASLSAMLAAVHRANAQSPDAIGKNATGKQVRLVVPYPPGGPTDAAARILAEALRDVNGPAAMVENKPGGSGTIGTRSVMAAAPDGLTLLLGNNQTHATAPFLIKDAGYDPLADFTAIASIGSFPHVLVVRSDLGPATPAELVVLARAKPGALNYGSTGIGSGSHLAMELFLARTDARMQHVPYQGAAQMAGDIAAKRLDLALAILPSVLGTVTSGSTRALAVAGAMRALQLPDVPTLEEAGIKNANSESWLGLFGPAGISPLKVRLIEGQLALHIGQDATRRRLESLGIQVQDRPADLFRLQLVREIQSWREVIATAGLKAE